jgi:protein-S-isoprenylcysteine O-methyltransferase Ste14
MLTNIGLTIIFWIFYFFIHSFLANRFVKNRIISALHLSNKVYRLLYSLISVLSLLPIFYFLSATKSDFLLPQTQILKFISLALSTWGVIIIKMAFKNYRLREFLGFSNTEGQLELMQSGVLKYVRHPIYSGTILLFIGFWLFIPNVLNLVTVICTFLYLPIGIRLEEEKLIVEYGDLYRRYKDKVPALIPDLEYLLKSNQR